MLYDPKWEQQAKADPMTLKSLIAWLEEQPADRAYQYGDSRNCLLCQYLRAQGCRDVSFGGSFFSADGKVERLSPEFNQVAQHGHSFTFGAALERAREIANAR